MRMYVNCCMSIYRTCMSVEITRGSVCVTALCICWNRKYMLMHLIVGVSICVASSGVSVCVATPIGGAATRPAWVRARARLFSCLVFLFESAKFITLPP
jgi:hypothetical protein